ncbi:MAG: hypothetical protein IMZ61_14080 [Planctomycetes bacterium]|nr:hypothetical protein [Planctomycetota bacterium]
MAKKATEPSVKTTHETRYLKCMLTEDEISVAAQELARHLDEMEVLDDELKKVKADFKAQIERKEAELKVQKNLVRNKYIYRNVPCSLVLNYTGQTAICTRDDTQAIVEDRKMTMVEKQMDLGFDGADGTE